MSAQMPFIRLESVSKRYLLGEVVTALNRVNLEIERGDFTAVMGPSGSGKSTLLAIVGTLDTPTEGRYLLEGRDVSRLHDRELSQLRNRHFGFVFQNFHLFPEYTAVENVEVPLVLAGVRAKDRRDRALRQLELVGLADRSRHRPAQLSGGQQQRVAIARALVTDPSLILADEPTGNLSQEDSLGIMNLFAQLSAEGVGILVATHDPTVSSFAHRVIFLEDGQVKGIRMAGRAK